MAVLIVGADCLGNIPKQLIREEFIHWNGRCKTCNTKCIPKRVCQIVVCCDHVNHLLMYNIKKQAKKNGIPIIFSKRALSHNVRNLLA